ncbi:MAG: hypothetical protein HKN92_02055 [Chitinophagales bacterium]|nr:hypothetical protein [Chitinophagales bacterium]
MNDEKLLGTGSKVDHPKFGLGIVVELNDPYYKIYFAREGTTKSIDMSFDGLDIIEAKEPEQRPFELEDIENAINRAVAKYIDPPTIVPLGSKWAGGSMVLHPGEDGLQSKEIPIETFFHKIVMVRDRLRVLEQNINSSKKLDDEDKVNLQQYITRIYGSLTTFNVLFSNKEYYFKGEGRK